MQKLIAFIVVAIMTTSIYASYSTQSVNPIQLTSGVPMNGRVPDNRPGDYYTVVYSFYVPFNTSQVNLTITNTANDDQCEEITTFVRANGAPCTTDEYDDDQWFCTDSPEFSTDDGESDSQYFLPGFSQELAEFVPGGMMYFGVANYLYDYNNCTFTITATATASCSSSQVPIIEDLDYDSSTTACSSYTMVPYNGTSNYFVNVAAPGSGDEYSFALFAMNVPLETASIQIVCNFSSDVSVYGTQFSPKGYSDAYEETCTTTTSGSCGGSNNYCFTVQCTAPRAGLYWFNIIEDGAFNGTLSFTSTQCPAGKGGPGCLYSNTPLYINATLPASFTIPYNYSSFSTYNEVIYYIDIPVNFTGPDFYITATSSASSAYLVPRINGYPTSENFEFESQSISSTGTVFAIGSFDYVFAARYYIAIYCDDSAHPCAVTLNFNSSAPLTSSSTSLSSTSLSSSTMSSSTASSSTASSSTASSSTASSSTASSSTNTATGRTTGSSTTVTGSTAAVTTAHASGVEVIVPSIVLLLVAFLLF